MPSLLPSPAPPPKPEQPIQPIQTEQREQPEHQPEQLHLERQLYNELSEQETLPPPPLLLSPRKPEKAKHQADQPEQQL